MKDTAKTAGRVAAFWCALLCAGALLPVSGCRTNPVTGGTDLMLISPDQELGMGDGYHPSIIFMYDGECLDPDLKRYLGAIVMRLYANTHRPGMRTDFTLVNSSVVNAFAIPGHVYATRGFVSGIENEAQFAAVMAHELGHVAAGHTAKQMTRQTLMSLGLGVTGAALGEGGRNALVLGQAGVALLNLSYSREMEYQADRVGTYYMALSGWDPREALSMQRLLSRLAGRKETVLSRYLSTHPPLNERLAEIQSVIDEKRLLTSGLIQGDGIYAGRWNRRMMGLREVNEAFEPYDRGNKGLAERNYDDALRAAEEAIGMRADQAQFHRLRGDALLGLDRLAEAEAAYRQALRIDRRHVPANIGLGQVAYERDEFAEAERQFATAAHGFPISPLAQYGLGLSRYSQQKYAEAIPPLEKAAQAAPDDPDLLYVLAECYDRTGKRAEAYGAYVAALNAGLTGERRRRALARARVLQPVAVL